MSSKALAAALAAFFFAWSGGGGFIKEDEGHGKNDNAEETHIEG